MWRVRARAGHAVESDDTRVQQVVRERIRSDVHRRSKERRLQELARTRRQLLSRSIPWTVLRRLSRDFSAATAGPLSGFAAPGSFFHPAGLRDPEKLNRAACEPQWVCSLTEARRERERHNLGTTSVHHLRWSANDVWEEGPLTSLVQWRCRSTLRRYPRKLCECALYTLHTRKRNKEHRARPPTALAARDTHAPQSQAPMNIHTRTHAREDTYSGEA